MWKRFFLHFWSTGEVDAKRKRYTDEQIIGNLREHEAGVPAHRLIRKHGVANGTFARWKSRFGGTLFYEATRLRELEPENAELMRPLAETVLEKTAVEESLRRKW